MGCIMGHAISHQDDGTPQEQSRRTFMANMVIGMSGVIGLVLGIPLIASMVPDARSTTAWTPLTDEEYTKLQAATETPVKVTFNVQTIDAYLTPTDEHFVWAIKTDEAKMRAKRPELFDVKAKLPYPVINMGFVLFSPICPHLGCPYDYHPETNQFACGCHGSKYDTLGVHIAGPAQRGLDPLPLRDHNGKAEVTWIHYKGNEPDHVVISYT